MGLLLAAVSTRALRGLLYGVTPLDPVTYGSAIALLIGVALLAGALPARRAARVDPRIAMEE